LLNPEKEKDLRGPKLEKKRGSREQECFTRLTERGIPHALHVGGWDINKPQWTVKKFSKKVWKKKLSATQKKIQRGKTMCAKSSVNVAVKTIIGGGEKNNFLKIARKWGAGSTSRLSPRGAEDTKARTQRSWGEGNRRRKRSTSSR